MQVLDNGKLLRTIPITAGKPGFTTRSGIKVIIEKFRHKRMDSATVGHRQERPGVLQHRERPVRPCASPTPASSSTPPRGRSAPRARQRLATAVSG